MGAGRKVGGSILATVTVVAVLMMVIVLAVISLWEADFLLFSRSNYLRIQRANIESAFILYRNAPDIAETLPADSIFILYDSLPSSRMRMWRQRWGMYEAVTVETNDRGLSRTGILGLAKPFDHDCVLWYKDNWGSVTLTGDSYIKGPAMLPQNGIVYGQMQSVFFKGEKISNSEITKSEEQMPEVSGYTRNILDSLFLLEPTEMIGRHSDSLSLPFMGSETLLLDAGNGILRDCYYGGRIIIKGKNIKVKSDCRLENVIVIGDNITIEDGFSGSGQFFATDSLKIMDNVMLGHPSGIYSDMYAEIGDGSILDGYFIVNWTKEKDVRNSNGKKSRLSKIRGLLYCSGIIQLQGILSGVVVVDEAVYYSSYGHYQNFLYDISLLPNDNNASPLWFETRQKRREARWVR